MKGINHIGNIFLKVVKGQKRLDYYIRDPFFALAFLLVAKAHMGLRVPTNQTICNKNT